MISENISVDAMTDHRGKDTWSFFSLLWQREVTSDVWRKYFYTQDLFKTISNPIMFPWILAVEEYIKCSWTGSDGIWAKIVQKADHIWFLPYRVLTIYIKESIELWGVPKDLSNLWDGCPECLWRKDTDAAQLVL